MAEKLTLAAGVKFDFQAAKQVGEYPFDQWFKDANGEDAGKQPNLIMLKKGTDYKVDTNEMVAKLRTAAKRRDKVILISRNGLDGAKLNDAIIIHTRDMMADELLANAEWKKKLAAKVKADQQKRKAKEKAEVAKASPPATQPGPTPNGGTKPTEQPKQPAAQPKQKQKV